MIYITLYVYLKIFERAAHLLLIRPVLNVLFIVYCLEMKKPAGTAEEVERHFGCESSRLVMVDKNVLSNHQFILFLFCCTE